MPHARCAHMGMAMGTGRTPRRGEAGRGGDCRVDCRYVSHVKMA